MKQIFLDNLPRKQGLGKHKNKQVIDWKNSTGYIVRFVYDDITGELKIINYINKSKRLIIKYLDNDNFEISTTHFCNCKLGNMLGKITKNFKIEVETHIKDNERDLIILDREYRKTITKDGKEIIFKWYKYKCNNCGFDNGWATESPLLRGVGCSACCLTPKTIVEGINDIPTTAPWMVKYFQGGYEEAKLYAKNSEKRICPICPDCGKVKDKSLRIQDIYKEHSIGCSCGDGISYPEKFMYNFLKQLNIKSITHANSKVLKWCNNYIYDFYIPSLNCIIETHGIQHYKEAHRGRSLEEEQDNDTLKEKLAKENGIDNYVVINCKYCELNWVKDNILNSKLRMLLNFNEENIDWLEIEKNALNNVIKVACDYKLNNPNLTTVDIGKIMDLSPNTIGKYLKKGNKLGWCYYDVNEEARKRNIKGAKNSAKKMGKPVEIFKDDLSLGKFINCHELSRQSEELFGIKFYQGGISEVCRGEVLKYKGYTFKYI